MRGMENRKTRKWYQESLSNEHCFIEISNFVFYKFCASQGIIYKSAPHKQYKGDFILLLWENNHKSNSAQEKRVILKLVKR